MKNKVYILLFAGVIMIIAGVVYALINKPTTPEPTVFTGKYFNDNKSIYIYEIDDSNLYFVIKDDVMGKATINNNEANGMVFDKNYKFTLNGNQLTVNTNDSNIDGVYTKDGEITIEELYKFGDDELLKFVSNSKYSNEKITIIMYRINKNTVVTLIDSNSEKVLRKFTNNDYGVLESIDNDDKYKISLSDGGLLYTKEGDLEFFQEELTLEKRITSQEVFELFIEHQ